MAVRIQHVGSKNAGKVAALVGNSSVDTTAVRIVDRTPGPVSKIQSIKGYYQQLVLIVTAIVSLLTEVQTLTPFLPAQYRGWISAAVVFGGLVAAFLKENEQWVNDL